MKPTEPGQDLPAHSLDGLLGGKLPYAQPIKGYRVGLEAPLLAAFAAGWGGRPPRHIVDLGSGPGAVGLCAAHYYYRAQVSLVEAAPQAQALALENLRLGKLGERARLWPLAVDGVGADADKGVADLVLSNPPWFGADHYMHQHPDAPAKGRGALANAAAQKDPDRALARRMPREGLRAFCKTARHLMGRKARFCIAFPSQSLQVLLSELSGVGLAPKRLLMLHARASQPANVVFVEAKAAKPGGLEVLPPWVVRGEGEAYLPEMKQRLWGEGWGDPYRNPRPAPRKGKKNH